MPHVRQFVEYIVKLFPIASPVVEIGSFLVEGQRELADMRPFFRGKEYIGCDLRSGPGVDRIEDIQNLSFASESIGTLLVLETLEHVQNPFKAIAEMYRVLSPNGLLVISVPFHIPVHEFPNDYWRFTPACLEMLLAPFYYIISWENALVDYDLAKILPRSVFALATKQPIPAQKRLAMETFYVNYSHFCIDKIK